MTPPNQFNHYATLKVSQTASLDEIKKAYKRQALLLHPDKNPGDCTANAKFCQLGTAYEALLSNRSPYDKSYATRKAGAEGSGQNQRNTDEAPSSDEKSRGGKEQEETREQEARIRSLLAREREKINEMLLLERKTRELERAINESAKVLEKVQERLKSTQGWFGYMASWVSKRQDLKDQKLQLEQEEVRAITTRTIKEMQLKQEKQKLQGLQIEAMSFKNERLKLEEQACRRRQQKREKQWREDAARSEERRAAAREQQRKQEAVRAQERLAAQSRQQQQQAARDQERAAQDRAEQTARRARAQRQAEPTTQKSDDRFGSRRRDQAECFHSGWWLRREGSASCENCLKFYRSWILACPNCDMKACASCRPLLQKNPGRPAMPQRTYNN